MQRHTAVLCLLLLAWGAAQAQDPITPAQAVQSVRQFCGDPGVPVNVMALRDYGPFSYQGLHYWAEVDSGDWKGTYWVCAVDGTVFDVLLSDSGASDPPALTMTQAQACAEQFVRAHYPAFDQRQWALAPEYYRLAREGTYAFDWAWVLNAYGTLAPFELNTVVNGNTGRVVAYGIPRDRITGPTVPQVSQAQAEQIAAPFAPYDPAEVPFSDVYLRMYENHGTGIQDLWWYLYQHPDPEYWGLKGGVFIDAITGEVKGVLPGPFGGLPKTLKAAADKAPKRRNVPTPRLNIVRSAQGRAFGSWVVAGGRLWARVEVLRGFGAKVEADEKSVRVRVGERAYAGKALGAERRDYGWWVKLARPANCPGWWVPLRQAVEALGWRVKWHPKTREAVVFTDGAPPANAGS